MVMYDIGNRESFQSCVKWYTAVRNACAMNESMLGVLVGNKADLREGPPPTQAEVGKSDATKMSADLGVPYFELSAVSYDIQLTNSNSVVLNIIFVYVL